MFVTDFIILKGDVAWLCDRVPSSVTLVEITVQFNLMFLGPCIMILTLRQYQRNAQISLFI